MKFRILTFFYAFTTCGIVHETSAKKVDCSNLQRMPLRYQCCPMPELVTADLLDKCNDFMHPKYSYNSKNNGYDPSDPWESTHPSNVNHKRRTIAGAAITYPCFLECIVNNSRIMDNHYVINEPELTEFLEEAFKHDNDLLPIMTQSFRVCSAFVRQMQRIREDSADESNSPRNSDPFIRERCPTLRTMLFSCAMIGTFNNCPSTVWYNTEECNENRQMYRECMKILEQY